MSDSKRRQEPKPARTRNRQQSDKWGGSLPEPFFDGLLCRAHGHRLAPARGGPAMVRRSSLTAAGRPRGGHEPGWRAVASRPERTASGPQDTVREAVTDRDLTGSATRRSGRLWDRAHAYWQ